MRLYIELSSVWHLWPLVTWDWSYFEWTHCEQCGSGYENGHYKSRSITVTVWLPFARLTVAPGIEFKTAAAIGCPIPPRTLAPF